MSDKKWQSTAGPLQTKRVNEALLSAIKREGQSHIEILGVKGSEMRSKMWSPFGGCREEASKAMEAIGDKFNWQLTRENCQQIIAEAQRVLAELEKTTPVDDKSETQEDRDARHEQYRAADEARRAADQAEASQAEERARALRQQYPWAIEAHKIAGVQVAPSPERSDPAGSYVEAQENARLDAIASAIGA